MNLYDKLKEIYIYIYTVNLLKNKCGHEINNN